LARRLTARYGRLTLAHVHNGELDPLKSVQHDLLRRDRATSEELLERERTVADVSAELQGVVALHAGAGLHQQADCQHADLLVVGSCSRGAFGRAMLGDHTREALNGAPCTVAVAARGYAERPDPIKVVGVAYNESPESEAALAFSRRLAESMNATVRALEVVSIPSVAFTGIVPPAIGESIDVMLSRATARMSALPGVDGSAIYGLPGEELAIFSGEVDLLVVGSRGYGPVKRLVLGSTSGQLALRARCSLLVRTRLAVGDDDPIETRLDAEVGDAGVGTAV
jgi:nucleotide-binding universal stress UspA family protein